jgi:hypothetical protein
MIRKLILVLTILALTSTPAFARGGGGGSHGGEGGFHGGGFHGGGFPDHVLTTEQIGRAMLTVARQGYLKRVLESKDIRAVAHR